MERSCGVLVEGFLYGWVNISKEVYFSVEKEDGGGEISNYWFIWWCELRFKFGWFIIDNIIVLWYICKYNFI